MIYISQVTLVDIFKNYLIDYLIFVLLSCFCVFKKTHSNNRISLSGIKDIRK